MTQTESAILVHARRCAPAESCGFVIGTPEGERYQPCVNISAEPEAYFRIAPEDWLQAEMQGEIVALVHSHPGGLPWLSEADRRLQIKSALPSVAGLPGGNSQIPLCAAPDRASF